MLHRWQSQLVVGQNYYEWKNAISGMNASGSVLSLVETKIVNGGTITSNTIIRSLIGSDAMAEVMCNVHMNGSAMDIQQMHMAVIFFTPYEK